MDWQAANLDSVFTLLRILWLVFGVLDLQRFTLECLLHQFVESLFSDFWAFVFYESIAWHESKLSQRTAFGKEFLHFIVLGLSIDWSHKKLDG